MSTILTPADATRVSPSVLPPHWSRTAWGRILLGLVLAQGLFYGLYLSLVGFVEMGTQLEVIDLSALQLLQLVAVLLGSLFGGAGQRQGLSYGGIVGMISAMLFAIGSNFLVARQENLPFLTVLEIGTGVVGGFLGALIWPAPYVGLTAVRQTQAAKRRIPAALLWRVHWVRVLMGTVIAAAGMIFIERVLRFVLMIGGDELGIDSRFQRMVVHLALACLGVVIGGALAGGRTWNGLLQGGVVGLLSLALVLGFWQSNPDLAIVASAKFVMRESLEMGLGLLTVGIVAVGMLGGWFGQHLLRPMLRNPGG